MNAREIKLVVAALLFTGAAAGAYWSLYLDDAQGPAAAAAGKSPDIPPAATIDLNLMRDETGGGDPINIFNYRRPELIAAEPPPDTGSFVRTIEPPPPPVVRPPTPVTQPAAPAEPPVVNIPLAYSGFARDENDEMVAFIEITQSTAGVSAGRFSLREDDFLVGRFRIARITPDLVELEDMDRPERTRKQSITIHPSLKDKGTP